MSNPAADSPLPLAPHAVLRSYYGSADRKARFLRDIFNETAGDYDKVESALAMGTGRWYRRQALRRAGLRQGMSVLDVAAGTGLVAREALQLVGQSGSVTGVDPSIGMLSRARIALPKLRVVLGVGESLPAADKSVEFVSMGYALRHLPDLRTAFAEFLRVLRPGGRVCILEISRPAGEVGRRMLDGYFRIVLPILARVVDATPQTNRLWQYYRETIDQCVSPERVQLAMREAGFCDVQRHVSLGVFSEFTGTRLGP